MPADRGPGPLPHVHFRQLIQRHVDGDISDAENDELFAHLETCEDCSQILEAEERLLERLMEVPRMVAPSDMRAQILREAARDREESMMTADPDNRYGRVLRMAEPEETEDGNLFEGVPRARRRRSTAQRFAPAAAALFVFVSGTAALLTGNFSQIRPLAVAQGAARTALSRAVALVTGQSFERHSEPQTNRIEIASPAEKQVIPKVEDNSIPPTGGDLGRTLARLKQHGLALAEAKLQTYERAAARMAEVARNSLPAPAERERPVMAAIVLKPTDKAVAANFEMDDFTSALRATAEERLGGQMASEDQFVYGGQRYHCYTLNVSGEWFDDVVTRLEAYRTNSDSPTLSVLAEQGHRVTRAENVGFFSAPKNVIRTAVSGGEGAASHGAGDVRQVRIFVVE
ncbi:MAG: zf-HC2 domain-containing protein [Candidatus Sumerlaeaceae bacterium]|nr:zf-HC2 domain-containing protein [Candidatus Sumerlaeaceae bacterium]